MPDSPTPPVRRPLGPPLPSSDADLEARSRVDAEAIRRVRLRWPEVAPGRWRGLIEAKAEKDER